MILSLLYFSIFILLMAYGGYTFPAWIWMKIKRSPQSKNCSSLPDITLLVAAYNEAEIIEDKIRNCLNLNYPKDKLDFVFVTDGSTDETPDIIKKYPNIQLQHTAFRDGKSMAINRAMQKISTSITIFSDANTMLNEDAVMLMAKSFMDPNVGAVAGEKKVLTLNKGGANTVGEGVYWKYESVLKNFDAQFYSTMGAAGELFGIRTTLYEHIPGKVLLDDFVISMNICLQGWKIAYQKGAVAIELPSANTSEEKKRKTRIATGAFQTTFMLWKLLRFWRHPRLSYLYISHRLLRWTICPFLLPVILITNILVVLNDNSTILSVLLGLQIIFYVAGVVGWILDTQKRKSAIFSLPYYFIFMNLTMYTGLYRFAFSHQTGVWEKAIRSKNQNNNDLTH
jgi:cellulose synthase/poly-beta-1,6-N-acetylglucosamine synthase-like glycosyltransferase